MVKINANENNNHLQIVVSDNGPGIENEDIDAIFKLFKTSSKNLHDGIGIGLATVKSLVETLGGSITVHSEKGIGTDFLFTLPK